MTAVDLVTTMRPATLDRAACCVRVGRGRERRRPMPPISMPRVNCQWLTESPIDREPPGVLTRSLSAIQGPYFRRGGAGGGFPTQIVRFAVLGAPATHEHPRHHDSGYGDPSPRLPARRRARSRGRGRHAQHSRCAMSQRIEDLSLRSPWTCRTAWPCEACMPAFARSCHGLAGMSNGRCGDVSTRCRRCVHWRPHGHPGQPIERRLEALPPPCGACSGPRRRPRRKGMR